MNRFKASILLGCAICLVGIASRTVLATPQDARENAIKVGSLIVDNKPAGSCFFVDQRGYVATCFWNVVEADDARVIFGNGGRFKVNGVIAASKGKDIAILKIAPLTHGTSLGKEALVLDSATDPKVDDGVFPWGGPNALPAIVNGLLPKIKRRLLGEEYLLGLPKAPSSDIGCDPDTRWIWLSFARHRSCNGGPVFDRDGKVLGMLSASLDPGSKSILDPAAIVYSAIHIEHVADLIPADDVKPKSLKTLQNWVDPIPNIDTIKPIRKAKEDKEQSLGSALRRELSVSERLADLQRRTTQVEQENAAAEKQLVQLQSDNLELLAKIEKIETELKSIRPEERYTESYQEIEYKTETTTTEERGRDGKMKEVKTKKEVPVRVTKTRTAYRYSGRQNLYMAGLRKDIFELQMRVQENRNEFAFDSNIRVPFVTQIRRHLEEECFYLADPLGIRVKPEQQSIEAELTKSIDEGGAAEIFYVARAMSRIAQGDLEGAEFDLKEANEVDTKFRTLVQGLEGRVQVLRGNKNRGVKVLKDLTTDFEADARIRVIAARVDLDLSNYGAAIRHLEQAAKLSPNEIEIKLGLAWALTSATRVDAKRATDTATEVVRMTAGRDWSAVAALAAAYSHCQKSDLAIQTLEAAIRIAPPSALEACEKWRSKLSMQQPIEPEW